MIQVGQKQAGRTVHKIVNGVSFSFEQRRYFGKHTFTYAYRWDHDRWFDAGDPRASAIVPKRDLEHLAAEQPGIPS
jgi:hypothetical protein